MRIIKYLTILVISVVILTSCQSSSSQESTKSGEFRIVPTTVALTMTLDKLDLPIVGKPTSYKTLPNRYKDVPEIGQPMEPNVEAVKKLKPTHVLSVSQAKELNDHLNSVKQKIENKAAKQKKHPKVLILMGVPGSYLVATDKSYIGDLVKIAGGENVIKVKDRQYISSNTENLLNINPDIILRLPHGMPEEVKKMFQKEFKQNDIWKHFKAVKNNHVYDLEEVPFGITANVDADKAMTQLYDLFYKDKK